MKDEEDRLLDEIAAGAERIISRADGSLLDFERWESDFEKKIVGLPPAQQAELRESLARSRERVVNMIHARDTMYDELEGLTDDQRRRVLDKLTKELQHKKADGSFSVRFAPDAIVGTAHGALQRKDLERLGGHGIGRVNSVVTREQLGLLPAETTETVSSDTVKRRNLDAPRMFGEGLHGTRVVDPIGFDSDNQDWFEVAMKSLRCSEDGKWSSPLAPFDFELAWTNLYEQNQVDYGPKTAKEVAERHIREFLEYAQDLAPTAKQATKMPIAIAIARHKAIVDTETEDEAKQRASLLLAATCVNMQVAAIGESLLNKPERLPAAERMWETRDTIELLMGFGPTAITTDDSWAGKRHADADANNKTAVDRAASAWRLALAIVAFPNIADTMAAMREASNKASKLVITPPDGSPANAEVRLMQVAYWAALVGEAGEKEARGLVPARRLLDAYCWLLRMGEVPGPWLVVDVAKRIAEPRPESFIERNETDEGREAWRTNRNPEFRGWLRLWAMTWRDNGYARLDVGHKLAAALMLTDIKDDVEVKAPWTAFSVHVPPGITRVSRILVIAGDATEEGKMQPLSVIFEDGSFGEFGDRHLSERELDLLRNFVRGCCLAVAQGSAKREGNHGTTGAGKTKRHAGKPLAGERYQLSAPVKIDLRELVREHLDGKRKGGSPKVQFIVRGHWRNQVHGPGRAHRKVIWIEPFWKGDPEAVVLLRGHQVEGDKLRNG